MKTSSSIPSIESIIRNCIENKSLIDSNKKDIVLARLNKLLLQELRNHNIMLIKNAVAEISYDSITFAIMGTDAYEHPTPIFGTDVTFHISSTDRSYRISNVNMGRFLNAGELVKRGEFVDKLGQVFCEAYTILMKHTYDNVYDSHNVL